MVIRYKLYYYDYKNLRITTETLTSVFVFSLMKDLQRQFNNHSLDSKIINHYTWWTSATLLHKVRQRSTRPASTCSCVYWVCALICVCVCICPLHCAGNELCKRLKVDTSRDARGAQAKTAHSSGVLIPAGDRGRKREPAELSKM